MEFNVKADVEAVKRALAGISSRQIVERAATSALNRVGSQVRTEAKRQIAARRNLKISYIRAHLVQRLASRTHLATTVRASGIPVPLNEYAARNTAAGVTVKVARDGSRKLVHKYDNKAFAFSRGRRAARGAMPGRPVMVRRGRSRLPIQKLFGPSIPTAFVKRAVLDAFRAIAEKKWPERFEHELRFRLAKLGFDVHG